MPDYISILAKIDSMQRATSLQEQLKSLYYAAKSVQGILALYQAGTDVDFNATIDAIFTGAERTQIAQMLNNINTLVTAWEANHQNLLS